VALSFRSEPLYLALSPDTPDAVVNRLQKALDEVIAEGYAGCSKTPDLCYLIQNRGKTLAGSR
jgi:polar amino acid transport system substrate-binding protein